jgi:RND family efflux transporter MFP subunit
MRFLSNRRVHWAGLGLLAAIAIAGFLVYRQVGQAAASSEEPTVQTATARQGDLILYASGSGTLEAFEEIALGFDGGGTLTEVSVRLGDTVKAGQVLARVDTDEAEQQLAQAERTLRELTSPSAIAAAQLAVADAQEALQAARRTYTVNQEGNRATADTIEGAQYRLRLAKEKLDEAQDAYERARGDGAKALAYDRYASARAAYNTALATYNWYTGHPTETDQAQLEADVALAQAALDEAEALLAALTGKDLTEDAYGEGLTALEDAQQAVETARQTLADTELVAPMDGVVIAMDGTVGQSVSGTVITLASITPRLLEVNLDQTDFDKLHVGDEAEIVFDALPDVSFTGRVTQIDPSLTSGGLVSTIRAIIQMDDDPSGETARILLGMSAAVDVISGRAMGATLIPVEALRELSPGEYAVFVMVDGTPNLAPVEVGLMDVTFAEILSGVQPGDVVTTGLVETE